MTIIQSFNAGIKRINAAVTKIKPTANFASDSKSLWIKMNKEKTIAGKHIVKQSRSIFGLGPTCRYNCSIEMVNEAGNRKLIVSRYPKPSRSKSGVPNISNPIPNIDWTNENPATTTATHINSVGMAPEKNWPYALTTKKTSTGPRILCDAVPSYCRTGARGGASGNYRQY